MLLARVIGTVWATRKDPSLESSKLQIVEPVDLAFKAKGTPLVAVDACEAGVGEIVLVAQGSSARQTKQTTNRPVDAVIMAIVDNMEVLDEKLLAAEYSGRRDAVEARLKAQAELS